MADQNKDVINPISSGLQPGPGEHLQSSETAGASSTTGGKTGAAATAAQAAKGSDASGPSPTSDKIFSTEALKESGTRIASEAKQYAGDIASRAKEKSRSVFQEQKDSAVGQVDTVASAIRSTASQLQGQGQGQVAHYIEMVADQLESIGGRLRDKDLDTLISDTQNLARRAPGTFLVGSVVAGFLLARFLKSSSEQRQYQLPMSAPRERYVPADDSESLGTRSAGAQTVGADGTPDARLGTSGTGAATMSRNGARSGGDAL